MKTKEMKKILLLVAGIIFMVGCAEDDNLSMIDRGNALSLRVIAENFTSGQSTPETRAAESGYTTTFTNNDRIGIIAVNGSAIIEDNIQYRYNGTTWQPVSSTIYAYPSPVTYIAYYPYSATMDGKKSVDEIIAAFSPQTDQSTYAAYTASDLMTGAGTISGTELEITLTHALSLVEVKLPQITYAAAGLYFYGFNTIGTLTIGGTPITPYATGDGTYRYITKSANNATVSGSYDANGKTISFLKESLSLLSGKYDRLNVTHAGWDTPVVLAASYSVGDYFPDPNVVYSNGNLVSGYPAVGVVYEISDGGSHGRIMSLELGGSTWGAQVVTGATSETDGLANIFAVANYIENNNTYTWADFSGYAFVNAKNPENTIYTSGAKGIWFFPALEELRTLRNSYFNNSLAAKLTTAGGMNFGSYDHWSSTESSETNALSLEFYSNIRRDNSKTIGFSARAVLAF